MPNEADKELEKMLEDVTLRNHTHGADYVCPVCAEAKAQLLAWRDRAVRAGRIDELQHVCDGEGNTHWHDYERDFASTIQERIATLSAELKEKV